MTTTNRTPWTPPTGTMRYFTIFARGRVVGGSFGLTPRHASERYAEGSIYAQEEMTATPGVHHE